MRLARTPLAARLVAALCLGAALVAPAAHAGVFDDDEARRAILELRQKVDQATEQQRTRQADQTAAVTEQINQLKRSLLDLSNQLQQMQDDNAKLRGQNEDLARAVSELQRKQKDLQSNVDDRVRKLEPQPVTLDGKTFNADPDEKRQYEDAMDLLRKSDFAGTATALTAFRRRWPASGYTDSVLFWLGNSQYGTRQYKDAITAFRSLVSGSPDSAKAPEALLAIANCQAELKDIKTARRTIDELLKTYPQSEAAQAGKERLASLK
ncbi:MAG TPA: tol-pal system protein YbgF [Burkholderiaceae bacterium]|jgi:tol-pal system protein YbgF